ncbi:MAG: hypothetical protein OCD02_09625 [Spirochaetaceae bacterium]
MKEDRRYNIKLEQYKLDELSQVQNANIILGAEDTEYLDYIEQDNKDFFEKFDIKKLAAQTQVETKKKKIINFPLKTITTLAAAACLIIVFNILPHEINGDPEIIYLKGVNTLNIYKKDSDLISKLKNLDKVNENSLLQITYLSKDKYGVIFSIDGLNNITYHFPEDIYETTYLDIGKEITLPTSYTLDNAPYFEKFYMITTDSSLNMSLIKESISKIRISDGKIIKDLKLPNEYNIANITLLKD